MEISNETIRESTDEVPEDPVIMNGNKQFDYYADYDPMVGIRIAISLGVLITLFTIFILYKTQCNARRTKRILSASLKARDHGLDNFEYRTRTLSNEM